MFEKERAEIMVLSNIASAQGLTYVSDLLRTAQSEWAKAEEYRAKLQPQVDRMARLPDLGDE